MAIIQTAMAFWQDRQRRNYVILAVLSLILAGIVAHRLLQPKPLPPGALRRVMCVSCLHQCDMVVDDIDDPKYRCPKCDGKVAYAWKCESCHFEYPLQPKRILPPSDKTMDKFRAAMEMYSCPNCNSSSTSPMDAAD